MQPFVCPQCGHRSSYNPWVESAHCPQCGYEPSTDGPVSPLAPERVSSSQDLDRFFSQLDDATTMTPSRDEPVTRIYSLTKEMAPHYIMLVRVDDYLYTFANDARIVIEICGTDVHIWNWDAWAA